MLKVHGHVLSVVLVVHVYTTQGMCSCICYVVPLARISQDPACIVLDWKWQRQSRELGRAEDKQNKTQARKTERKEKKTEKPVKAKPSFPGDSTFQIASYLPAVETIREVVARTRRELRCLWASVLKTRLFENGSQRLKTEPTIPSKGAQCRN